MKMKAKETNQKINRKSERMKEKEINVREKKSEIILKDKGHQKKQLL
jgi:hypothetical protein